MQGRLLCTVKIVTKSEEVKPGCCLAESFKEGCGSKMAALSMIMMMMMMTMMIAEDTERHRMTVNVSIGRNPVTESVITLTAEIS
jgi:hypothetical protein